MIFVSSSSSPALDVMAEMRLSLAIPVWNDADGVRRLVLQAADFGLFHEVIVVDDASDETVDLAGLDVGQSFPGGLSVMRTDAQRGAGHARNLALRQVTGTHVLFFDSDDLFGRDFAQIVALARDAAAPFDFLIFRHDDSRRMGEGLPGGSYPMEEEHWQAVGAVAEAMPIDRQQAARLCRLSAYPWNKIYRTDFLRDNNLRCTEIMVHNDVELHWTSFVAAERILTTTLIGAVHFVAEGGSRLTNRRSAERLEVFEALGHVAARIRATVPAGGVVFLLPFARFCLNLIDWIERNLDADLVPELKLRAHRFFLRNLDGPDMTLIAHADPALARRILRLLNPGAR